MKLFISYSRRDALLLDPLLADLGRAGHEVLIDRRIPGGQLWWDEIIENLRRCDALIFVVSPYAIESKACRLELAYGVGDLRKPLLPVMLRETNIDLAPDPIGSTEYVDYRERTSESAIELMVALRTLPEAPPLPDPPPPPPTAPVTDLAPVREKLNLATLTPEQQREILDELRDRSGELDQAETLRNLLGILRRRKDIVESIGHEADALLSTLPIDDSDADAPPRRPMSQRDPDSLDRLRSLLTYVRDGKFTPILGHGLNDGIIGSTRRLALEWAQTFEFPMAGHQHEEVADVAQFVEVMTNTDTMLSTMVDYLLRHLRSRSPGAVDEDADLATAIKQAWRDKRDDDDPYTVLASLPCPFYIVAHPWPLMSEALVEAGRRPVVEVCRWNPDVDDWPESVFDRGKGFKPTVEEPLVFHVYGSVEVPDSVVLTLDDFDEFMIAVAENRDLIPKPVRKVLVNSAITLLGFELEDRDVRVLLRSLIGQGSRKLDRFSHVAAQIEFGRDVTSPERAQKYLERYFARNHQPSIEVFWGTVEEFVSDLAALNRGAS